MLPEEEIIPALVPCCSIFKQARTSGETLGDFCQRKGGPKTCWPLPTAVQRPYRRTDV